MRVLAIDTAGETGGVLVARNESASYNRSETEILGTRVLEPRKFSMQLISAAEELLEANRWTLEDVDAIAVLSGPGSFTGLRVGLSAVKAMAEVTAKPIIALSRLAVMASSAEACGSETSADRIVHAVIDAGRGEFYHGIYRDGGWTCVAESLQTTNTLISSFRSLPGLIVASEPAVLDRLSGSGEAPCQIPEITVREALPLIFASWRSQRFADVALLDANYLRRMEPKIASREASAMKPADTQTSRS